MNTNDLLTISQAAKLYNIPTAAIERMSREGLVYFQYIDGKKLIIADQLRRVAEYAIDDPNFLTCVCNDGPCQC